MSSDEDYDSSANNYYQNERRDQQLSSLTSILFGNIDSEGNLVDDILDDDSKRHLSSLQRHLSAIIPLNDIVDDEEDNESGLEDNDERDRTSDTNTSSQNSDDNRTDDNRTNGQNRRKRSNSIDSSYGSQNQNQLNGNKLEDCMKRFFDFFF